MRCVVFYLPDDLEALYRDVTRDLNKSRWFRDAVSMYLDVGSRDTVVMSSVPDQISPKGWTKHMVNVPNGIFDTIVASLPQNGDLIYTLASKAAIYRLILESSGAQTIPICFTSDELESVSKMGLTVSDAIHRLFQNQMLETTSRRFGP